MKIYNYKFYESQNLKNKDEEVNSLTFHHWRSREKYSNNNTVTNASNIYIETKVVPVITDSNFSETHDDNCPIHGDKNINEQE